MDADDIETVIQILTEFLLSNGFLQIPVCRGDDPDVRLESGIASDPRKLPLLKDAEELALHRQGHLANLIQEESASVALLEASDTLGSGAGEGTLS